jgi:hypothetical protein
VQPLLGADVVVVVCNVVELAGGGGGGGGDDDAGGGGGGGEVDPPPASLIVTTPLLETVTETVPPDSVAVVAAALLLLSDIQACAEVAEKPDRLTLMFWLLDPELVKTTMTLPSVFWNAAVTTPDGDPETATRFAPGRMKRLHMTKAQNMPLGLALLPLLSIKWLALCVWACSKPSQKKYADRFADTIPVAILFAQVMPSFTAPDECQVVTKPMLCASPSVIQTGKVVLSTLLGSPLYM